MYSLNCDYYIKSFETLDELIEDVILSGMDPNYEILKGDSGIGEAVADLIAV
jgi:hypothetical protein